MIILAVNLKMLGQLIDTLRQKCDLDRGRTGIVAMGFVIVNYFFLYFSDCCHKNLTYLVSSPCSQ